MVKNTKYVKNNLNSDDIKRFDATLELFKKYGDQYGFDWLMLAALAYQCQPGPVEPGDEPHGPGSGKPAEEIKKDKELNNQMPDKFQ